MFYVNITVFKISPFIPFTKVIEFGGFQILDKFISNIYISVLFIIVIYPWIEKITPPPEKNYERGVFEKMYQILTIKQWQMDGRWTIS